MTSSKEIFLKEKALVKWWVGICHDPRFDQVCTFARADIMQQRPTGEQMIGCELLINTLHGIIDPEAAPFSVSDVGIGLNHDIHHHREMVDEPEKSKKD